MDVLKINLFHFCFVVFSFVQNGAAPELCHPKWWLWKGMASPSLTLQQQHRHLEVLAGTKYGPHHPTPRVPRPSDSKSLSPNLCWERHLWIDEKKTWGVFLCKKHTSNTWAFALSPSCWLLRFCSGILFEIGSVLLGWSWKVYMIHIKKNHIFRLLWTINRLGKNACMPPKVACRTVPASASTMLSSDRLFSVSFVELGVAEVCESNKLKFVRWRSKIQQISIIAYENYWFPLIRPY